jgi:hypothetical protein
MVMRYHWGLAVGHVYTHGWSSGNDAMEQYTGNGEECLDASLDEEELLATGSAIEHEEDPDVENLELSLENRDNDDWVDSGSESDSDGRGQGADLSGGEDSADEMLAICYSFYLH